MAKRFSSRNWPWSHFGTKFCVFIPRLRHPSRRLADWRCDAICQELGVVHCSERQGRRYHVRRGMGAGVGGGKRQGGVVRRGGGMEWSGVEWGGVGGVAINTHQPTNQPTTQSTNQPSSTSQLTSQPTHHLNRPTNRPSIRLAFLTAYRTLRWASTTSSLSFRAVRMTTASTGSSFILMGRRGGDKSTKNGRGKKKKLKRKQVQK